MNNTDQIPLYKLRLYVRGSSPKTETCLRNLQTFCDRYLMGRHQIEIVDIEDNPTQADIDDIIAVPTLVRLAPAPIRRIVGDFSNTERLLQALDISFARELNLD